MTERKAQGAGRNYPLAQQTGRQGELWVETFFTNAGWTVGAYQIDDGYDLFVTPPRDDFNGQSFLVQVKGKAKRQRGGVFAPVARKRLRDYAANIMPVFIFRVFVGDNTAYWVHAQRAVEQNPRLAIGTGEAQVPLPPSNQVCSIEQFVEAAREILLPLYRRCDGVMSLMNAKVSHLSSLDDTMNVSMVQQGQITTFEFSEAEGKTCTAEITATFADQNLEAVEAMVDYGQPAIAKSDAVIFTGSPVFTELGLDRSSPATIEISPLYREACRLKLRPSKSANAFDEELIIPCLLSKGTKGITIESTPGAPLGIRIRGTSSSNGHSLKMNLQLPESFTDGQDLALKQSVGALGKWAEQAVLNDGVISGEIVKGKQVIKFYANYNESYELLHFMSTVGKLHHVARLMNSSYRLTDLQHSKKEIWLIECVYRMLRGETLDIGISSANIPCSEEDLPETDDYVVPFLLPLTFGGQLVCPVPIELDLRGYDRFLSDTGSEIVLARRSGSTSKMTLKELRG